MTVIVWIANHSHFIEDGVMFPPVVELLFTFSLIIFSSDALRLLISSVVKTENTAMTVMPFALIIQLIMSGMIFELQGLPKLISAFTISRWGVTAICSSADVNGMTFIGLDEYASTPGNLTFLWWYCSLRTIAVGK